ncbi:hypothetical protein ACO0LM_00675 [Undibacterium sp. Di26W]|uniref:hypothetical protein n=1 Tax=Undibacterium sp. Di26W TaxID=3413035 RepID=UPI003BF274C5
MIQTDMNDSLAAVEIVKNSLAALREQREAIIAEERALTQKKKELKAQPVPISDVKQALMDYVDARASLFLQDGQWVRNLRQFLYPNRDPYTIQKSPAALNYDEAADLSAGDTLRKVFPMSHPKLVIPDVGLFETTDIPLLFFFGDLIKAKIGAYFDAMQISHEDKDLNKIGTPIAERTLEIERIDTRLSDLVSQRSAIDSQISSLSV